MIVAGYSKARKIPRRVSTRQKAGMENAFDAPEAFSQSTNIVKSKVLWK
jgi:hypothetical protein